MLFIRRTLTGLFLVAITVGLFAAAANSFRVAIEETMNREERRRPARERVFAVNTLAVEPTNVVPTLEAFGEMFSRRSLETRSSAAGRVVFLSENFEDGATVAAGELLAQVDPTDAEAALDVAKTDLAEAEAELREAERNLSLAQDDLTQALAQADLRQAALARQQDLAGRGVGTAAAVEDAQLAVASAQQSVLTRRISVANAEGRIDQAKNGLSRRQIALRNAERDLADTEIRAAFGGVLADVSIVAGGLVTQNEQVAQLVDPDALEVSFRVSTSQFIRLLDDSGQPIKAPVVVTLDVLGLDLEARGRINRVDATVGEGQTGRRIFARLEGAPGFRPGDFVSVKIEEPELRGVARVPATAVGSDNTVFALNAENRLERVSVQLVRRQGDDVLIRAQDLAGRRIVAERTPLLGSGILVRDITAARAPEVARQEGGQPEGQTGGGGGDRITLTDERRAKLIAFVEGNRRMPAEAKERVLSQLKRDTVPARMVARLEDRMGS